MIYLDYAATTPMSNEAISVYQEIAQQAYGNAFSLHDIGTIANDIVTYSQQQLAELLHVNPQTIHFTKGGTHANQLAIDLLLKKQKNKGKHIIVSSLEHKSITTHLNRLEVNQSYEITYLPITSDGMVDLNQLKQLIRIDTVLVIVQHVNSEIGTIQPIQQISNLLKEKQILFHCDGIQAFGKLAINLKSLPVDSYALSSHKIYGPKGIGALYVHKDLHPTKEEIDSGTLDVPAIASFVTAAKKVIANQTEQLTNMYSLRRTFEKQLLARKLPVEMLTFNKQLPSIIGMVLDDIPGDYAMLQFNQAGIAISTGSACTVDNQEPNSTMLALGYKADKAKRFIRLSLGKTTTENDLAKAVQVCENMINKWYVI
ncbi:Putative cysteine desulfurase NifS [Paraliobacillus sp. PM-2]|uniref:IscS subfamily cysteine desulfurase n=1 Tax=Paraliobacillus sp. PM-2 TaxID=1462524 RepID=UPI00061C7A8C|nr:IscS subfamily cysteine desulfurase [Paraliobacillus sp. PM-2]CQR46970.1 Putative cysteine desulfurase NifS [Paraliobacillus sp. PM-2]